MPALLAMSVLGFSGYAALLPAAPLWAVHGGADEAGAGLVNGVLMLFTVLTQPLVPPALRRFGWGPVLSAGMLLLGLPALAHVLSDDLAPVLALSAARGLGFGVLTVTGSAAVAELVEETHRGRAIGAYGLAVAIPNLVLLPSAPYLAEQLGFEVVFVVSALPLLGVVPALRLARALHAVPREEHGEEPAGARRTAFLRLLRPTVLLLGVTLAGGALITFTPQMTTGGGLATAALLVMSATAALTRWRVGHLADRRGAQAFLWPLVVATVAGVLLVAWVVRDPGGGSVWALLLGMAVVGVAYGGLQNLTLLVAFQAVARRHYGRASAVWNVGFDAGTGLGSVVVGFVAAGTSFGTALLVVAALRGPVRARRR
jgi:MFS family permease